MHFFFVWRSLSDVTLQSRVEDRVLIGFCLMNLYSIIKVMHFSGKQPSTLQHPLAPPFWVVVKKLLPDLFFLPRCISFLKPSLSRYCEFVQV